MQSIKNLANCYSSYNLVIIEKVRPSRATFDGGVLVPYLDQRWMDRLVLVLGFYLGLTMH